MNSDYISEYESAVMIYINKYIRTNKFVGDEDIVKSLAGKVRWIYVRHKYMAGELEKYMPELTIEQIQEGYLNPHRENIYGRLRYVVNNMDTTTYNDGTITILDNEYKISDTFSEEEYKLLLNQK